MHRTKRGSPERGVDRMMNEGGGGFTLYDSIEEHLEPQTPRQDEPYLEEETDLDEDIEDKKNVG